jgi:hypothetical protein
MKMENTIRISKDVNIVAYYFSGQDKPKCFPKRMEIDGKQVVFSETGLRHPARRGHRMVQLFDMTDGRADYRLEYDAQEASWKLLYVADLNDEPYVPFHQQRRAPNPAY